MTTRRTFLKVGGAAAAIAAVAPLSTAAAEPTMISGEMAATLAPPSPYTTYPWKWMISHDGETFFEEFASQAEAIEAAEGYGEGMVVAECQQQDFDLRLRGDYILKQLYLNNEDIIGEGEFFDTSCTPEQVKELGDMVTAAIEAWDIKHKINLTAWMFGASRNETTIGRDV